MKPRHATAVALIGWYLMFPPIVSQSSSMLEKLGAQGARQNIDPNTRLTRAKSANATIDSDAPLARWKVEGSYDSARGCEAEREEFERMARVAEADHERTLSSEQWRLAVCIATNDPRLKGGN